MRSLVALIAFLSPQLALADCICLNRGEEIREGQIACINTSKGNRLALCEKNLNVTSWRFLGEECPTAKNVSPFEPKFQTAALQTFTPASARPSDQMVAPH